MVVPRSQHPSQEGRHETTSATALALHLARGGPFYQMQKKLGLLYDNDLKVLSRASLFSAAAWLVPLLLTLPMLSGAEVATHYYLLDPGPGSRFLIAIACFVISEQTIEREVDGKLVQLGDTLLPTVEVCKRRAEAIELARRQRNSVVAETICILLAVSAGVFALMTYRDSSVSTWAAQPGINGTTLTPAGWWCVVLSIPLFSFLFLRSLWRHFIFVVLLHRLARLDLLLVVTHPDGKAGLAFLGRFPNAFGLFVFGVSSAVAAALWKHLAEASMSATILTTVMGGWLLLIFAYFAIALVAFARPLREVKEASITRFSKEALVFQRAAENKALGENVVANDPDEKPSTIPGSDMTKNYEQARKLSTILIDRSTLLPIAASALLPFSIVGFSHLPLKEVVSVLKKLLLL